MKKESPLKVAAVIILAVVIAIMLVLIVLFKVWSGNGGLSKDKMKAHLTEVKKVEDKVSYERPDGNYTGKAIDKDSFIVSESSATDDSSKNNKSSDKKSKSKKNTSDSDYLCSYSATRLLTDEDIEELKSTQYDDLPDGKDIIQMVINEMYARHGYEFNNEDIQAYFDSKEWYKDIEKRNDNMDDIYKNMSDIERKNVDFISEYKED